MFQDRKHFSQFFSHIWEEKNYAKDDEGCSNALTVNVKCVSVCQAAENSHIHTVQPDYSEMVAVPSRTLKLLYVVHNGRIYVKRVKNKVLRIFLNYLNEWMKECHFELVHRAMCM